MNILMVGTIDSRGGAGVVSYNLKHTLAKQGHNVSMFVRWKYSNDLDIKIIPKNFGQDFLINFFANDLQFSNSDWILDRPEFKKADIVHCHNLHSNFFNLNTLKKVSKIKPVVWTQHDLWAITAGCTDSYRCRDPKPHKMFGYTWSNDTYLFNERKRVYATSNFHITVPSKWMLAKFEDSILKDKPIYLIPNGIDITIFTPHNKNRLRKALGIPSNSKVLLCNSVGGLSNELKGNQALEKIVNIYKDDKNILIISLGNKINHIQQRGNLILVPFISNKKDISKYYASADVFIYPTLADSFGMVVAESMACGTPIVSFNTDAIPELIDHQKQGYLAKYMDIDDLQKGIDWLLKLDNKEMARISASCVQKVNQQFSLEKMTDQYLDLYQKVIKDF